MKIETTVFAEIDGEVAEVASPAARIAGHIRRHDGGVCVRCPLPPRERPHRNEMLKAVYGSLYQPAVIKTHRDRVRLFPGRKGAAGDAPMAYMSIGKAS